MHPPHVAAAAALLVLFCGLAEDEGSVTRRRRRKKKHEAAPELSGRRTDPDRDSCGLREGGEGEQSGGARRPRQEAARAAASASAAADDDGVSASQGGGLRVGGHRNWATLNLFMTRFGDGSFPSIGRKLPPVTSPPTVRSAVAEGDG